MGHEAGGKLHLFPEEALFLLETTCLELMHNGVPMSIQEGYSKLLGPDTGCTFNEYQSYVHLVRQGYIVLRHSNSIRATDYERQIRLDQYSVGQKQCKMKENASVREIVIEDGNIDTKEHTGIIKESIRSEDMQNDLKIEEQEIIDVETLEIVNMNDDRTPDKVTGGMDEASKRSGSVEKSVSRSSLRSGNIKSNPFESKMTVRTDPEGKDISTINKTESGEETIKIVKDKTPVQEKDSQTEYVLGSDSNCKMNCISVDYQNCKNDLQVADLRCGINEENITGDGVSGAEPQKQSHSESSKTNEIEVISGITAQYSRIMVVDVETMTASSLKKSDIGICSQDGQSSKETNNENEGSSYRKSIEKCDNYTSELVKPSEPTSDEMTDVTIIDDDSSTSVDVSLKEIFSGDKNEIESQKSGCEGDKKQLTNMQNVPQKCENVITDYSDIVDVSDSSQISYPDLNTECSAAMRKCDNKKQTLIEIVSIDDFKDDADNEIVEVNHSASGIRCISNFRQRKSNQNSVKCSADKNERNVLKKNITVIKPDVIDFEGDAVTNVTLSPSTQNLKLGYKSRLPSEDTACFGRGKVTNIHLKHDEVEITPSIIDISEERVKQGPSHINQKEATSRCRTEIQVVDLEHEGMRPNMSWDEERMRILDSIPSIDRKFIIHVRVPDENLLPPNVCPQNKDYYIQKCRLSAPGIGGKLTAQLPNDIAQWQNGQPRQTDGQINPWIQDPTYFGGGGGIWNNNAFPSSGLFMNQRYQTPFPGASELRTVFHQAAALLSVFGNPAWAHNRMYGMPAPATMPQHSRVPYDQRPFWYHQTRPYHQPYYKRRRRRFETQYRSAPVTLGKQHFENQTSSKSDMIPLRVEGEVHERALKVPSEGEKYVAAATDNGVIECISVSHPTKPENEPMECTSGEGQKFDSGIDRHDSGGYRKRKESTNTRFFQPPKKLRSFIEKLRLETKEEKVKKDILRDEVHNKESKQEVLEQEDKASADVKSWRALKTVMQVVVLDSSSEDEDDVCVVVDDIQRSELEITEPLVQPEDCKNLDSVLKKLQIIKPMNFEHERKVGTNERLKISFDLYLPTATFRKASPGLPNYRITVVGYKDPIPEPKEMIALLKDFKDDVPLLFAVVLPNTVTFLQFGSVKLPVETFCS
ncbi:uncharacterized protein LOC110837598 isoform X4 [Zootermopsis nevadensis]|nr:uncharacterized protein LOC110837598 isoform X4 [Zootermopsis nevadensis]